MKECLQYHQLVRMVQIAMESHEGQYDIGGKPYFLHPCAVMLKVVDHYGYDYELMQIAMGHDLIEDTWIKEANLHSAGFSERVISGIVALSKRDDLSYEDYKKQVLDNEDAMRVKLMDIEHNSDLSRLPREPNEKDLRRLEAYKKFAQEISEKLRKE